MRKLFAHICVILSLVTLTLLVMNQFNPSVFGKPFFRVELLVYVIAVLILSIRVILRGKRKSKDRPEQANPSGV
jgi:hypothetical protein